MKQVMGNGIAPNHVKSGTEGYRRQTKVWVELCVQYMRGPWETMTDNHHDHTH